MAKIPIDYDSNSDSVLETDIDAIASELVSQMSPLEIGLLKYPFATPVKLKLVPDDVLEDHLSRYTKAELKRGQFFRVGDKYTFFMDHKAKEKREKRRIANVS